MKCPRCQSNIASSPDANGGLVCPSCGARLRSKNAAPAPARNRAVSDDGPPPVPPARASAPAVLMENPNATLPPGTPLRAIPKAGTPALLDLEPDVAPSETAPEPPSPRVDPRSTLVRSAPGKGAPAKAVAPAAAPAVSLEAVLDEIRALRRTQDEILELLRERPAREPASTPLDDPFGFGQETPTSVSSAAVRSRNRKSVLIIDDDVATRLAAVSALEKAEVPVRAVGDGNEGLQALADERSDVLVLELGVGGAMGGKDVVNLIKATMEWVDIPIVLYTRVPVQGQKEARQIHGADELVPKGPGSEDALVTRVISLFRRS